jgi:hypothetical protein
MQVNDAAQVLDRTVVDCEGTTIGSVTELYLDEHADRPGWIAVRTGLFGQHVSLVPLAGAAESGDALVVPFSKSQVKDAPHHDPEMALGRDEEATLFAYYGFPYADPRAATTGPGAPAGSTAGQATSAEYTTDDAKELETILHADAGTASTRLRRAAGRSGPGGTITGSAAAAGISTDDAVEAGDERATSRGSAIDVTEPATYPDDDLAADLRSDQDERERALRERQARGI